MSDNNNEFAKLRWFEHPATGEGHQFLVQKRYSPGEEFPHEVVASTWCGSKFGECVLRYSTKEKQEESFSDYFSEEEMLEFFNELVVVTEKQESDWSHTWKADSEVPVG